MSIKYDSRRELLADIIKKATDDATYVIPDLQRPYVWGPRQVIMLIDSLFRNWPFGSLLLWEVRPDCFKADEGIPHRPFWELVDRTDSSDGQAASSLAMPATYHMILDGQQRIQSLVLALGGDQWGFKLPDSEWALDLQDRRVRPSKHWSRGALCIDLQKFKDELKKKDGKARKVEAGKILEWAVLDSENGRSKIAKPPNYMEPLQAANLNPGKFVRLSRLWKLAQKDLSEREYKDLLRPILIEHRVQSSDVEAQIDSIAEFMKVVEGVKFTSFVHALQIDSLVVTSQWSKDDYCDAIVNIFTRLNTAGRTLTREEITLAWLKIGWNIGNTENLTAGECLYRLKSSLEDRHIDIEIDDVVRLISFVWAVEQRNGQLIDSKDLLKGEVVKPMAEAVAVIWRRAFEQFEAAAEVISARELYDDRGSFNSVIVFMAWFRIVQEHFDDVSSTLSVVQKDRLEKKLREIIEAFSDRWMLCSKWANFWADGAVVNFQNVALDLGTIFVNFRKGSAEEFLAATQASVSALMQRVVDKAIECLNSTIARDRGRVRIYYDFLWIWHRVSADRWKYSRVQLRTGTRRATRLEVDHIVANALWMKMVDANFQEKLRNFNGNEADREKLAPDGFETLDDSYAQINRLGNCALLEKSFNISKSDQPMWNFLSEVHEFKEGMVLRNYWEEALSLSGVLTDPRGQKLDDIRTAIDERDRLIRNDLTEFIRGQKTRLDMTT